MQYLWESALIPEIIYVGGEQVRQNKSVLSFFINQIGVLCSQLKIPTSKESSDQLPVFVKLRKHQND